MQADAAQIIDFRDRTSGQFLVEAFNSLVANPGSAQPWFENQMNEAIAFNFGAGLTCADFGFPSCSSIVETFAGSLLAIGDLSDTVQFLNANALLLPNVGLSGQFSTNAYVTNLGSSNYHGLLLSLRKRLSQNVEFDFNYTLSHSIDNNSSIVNTVIGGLICDIRNLRVCRADSDFDVRHVISTNWVYELPFGRGQRFFSGGPGWVDSIAGGWAVSGIWSWRTGFAFSSTTGSFPVGFVFNSPAVLRGSRSALEGGIHTDASGNLQYFRDVNAALNAMRNPLGGEIGNRNNLRGAHFNNVDIGIRKNIKMPYNETHRIQFRFDMFNAFNNVNFVEPAANINSGNTFGLLTTQRGDSRVIQLALRYDF